MSTRQIDECTFVVFVRTYNKGSTKNHPQLASSSFFFSCKHLPPPRDNEIADLMGVRREKGWRWELTTIVGNCQKWPKQRSALRLQNQRIHTPRTPAQPSTPLPFGTPRCSARLFNHETSIRFVIIKQQTAAAASAAVAAAGAALSPSHWTLWFSAPGLGSGLDSDS